MIIKATPPIDHEENVIVGEKFEFSSLEELNDVANLILEAKELMHKKTCKSEFVCIDGVLYPIEKGDEVKPMQWGQ